MTAALLVSVGCLFPVGGDGPHLAVGSKRFTESVILGEILTALAREAGANVHHRAELGSTQILWGALLNGQIDIYPDYTGTVREELLGGEKLDEEQMRNQLAQRGIGMSRHLGFEDRYALGMRRDVAEKLGIRDIADLRGFPDLKLGFSDEFMNRQEGWPSLRVTYQLPHANTRALDHDLAYQGIQSGALDVIDVYTTDAEIPYHDLVVLEDSRRHFPDYHAILLYRLDLQERAPQALASMLRLQGSISTSQMRQMNAAVKIDGLSEARVARDFVAEQFGFAADLPEIGLWRGLWIHTYEHLALVLLSMSAAIPVAIPLGIWAARQRTVGQIILGAVGIVQTIPSLALLVFMIPLFGIDWPSAVAALFLYSLLPIVRNTYTGLKDIAPHIRESSEALGLSASARLRLIELPLAARSILAGVKTSAVINVGTATLGALIGAGGYGQPILTGIRKDSVSLILQGAIPAALMALAVQLAFEIAERRIVPRGLRLRPAE